MGTDAFQEVDIFGMTLPVVKHSFVIRREDIPHVIAERVPHRRWAGRPGPVLVDIPKDVTQTKTFEPRTFVADDPTPPRPANGNKAAAEWMIAQAKRPLLYVGGGVVLGGAGGARLRDFAEKDRHSDQRCDPDGSGHSAHRPSVDAWHAGHARHQGREHGGA